MFERFVSLVLIAAVVACPMSCASGVCRADQCYATNQCSATNQCCGTNQCSAIEESCATDECCAANRFSLENHSLELCALHGITDRCFENSKEHGRHENAPYPCPAALKCQGVCGGAVFEKPCKLDGPFLSFFLPMVADSRSIVSRFAYSPTVGAEQHHFISAKNYGRFVRTLHSSLLC